MKDKEKSRGDQLRAALCYNKKNGYDRVDREELEAMEAYCTGYKQFLDAGKTERECVDRAVALAEAAEDGTGISTIEGADRTSGKSSAARARHAANGISHSRSSWSFHANTANRAAPVYCAHATAPAVTP